MLFALVCCCDLSLIFCNVSEKTVWPFWTKHSCSKPWENNNCSVVYSFTSASIHSSFYLVSDWAFRKQGSSDCQRCSIPSKRQKGIVFLCGHLSWHGLCVSAETISLSRESSRERRALYPHIKRWKRALFSAGTWQKTGAGVNGRPAVGWSFSWWLTQMTHNQRDTGCLHINAF